MGRFLTEDPYWGDIGAPPSLNRYLYAYGNPLRYIDPTGRMADALFREEEREAEGLTDQILSDAWAAFEGALNRPFETRAREYDQSGDYVGAILNRAAQSGLQFGGDLVKGVIALTLAPQSLAGALAEIPSLPGKIGDKLADGAIALSEAKTPDQVAQAVVKAAGGTLEAATVATGVAALVRHGAASALVKEASGGVRLEAQAVKSEIAAVESAPQSLGAAARGTPGSAVEIGANRLATGSGEAMFWSGVGRGGDTVAANVAKQQGRVTLEMTLADRGVKLPPWDPNNPASVTAWRQASHDFAAGASGNVRVLQGDAVRVDSVWAQVEFPALRANPNVKSITAIDAKTGAEVLLWSR